MIKIAICDDDKNIREEVATLLNNSGVDDISVEQFASSKSLLSSTVEEYNIIILDIEIDEMLGTEVAMQLRQRKSKSLIFFVTSHSSYISESFKSIPFQYIIKPINHELFVNEFKRAVKKIVNNKRVMTVLENAGALAVFHLPQSPNHLSL